MEIPKKQYASKWLIMAAVSMGVFLATIDGSIVNIALPTLTKELNADLSVIEWVVLAYLLTLTTLILGIGRWADMIGKKKLYLSGLVIFTISSALCGVSNRIELLIAFRVVQAIGASMLMALGTAIVTEAFPPSERGKALGISGTVVSIGIITGPTLGGIILDSLSWHWLFFVNLPVGIIGVWMVNRYVPQVHPAGGEKFDFIGAVTLFTAVLSLLLGLTYSQDLGFAHPQVYGMMLVGVLFLGLFIYSELRIKQPMIDLRLFQNRLFSVNLITGFFAFIAGSGTSLLMPFYLQNMLGMDARSSGLLMGVVPLIVGIIAPLSGTLSDKIGPRPLTAIGLFLLSCGYFAVSTLTADMDGLGYVLRFIPVGIGLGLFQSPNNSAVMGTAPKNRLGIVSGLLSITRTLGQTTGISILGAVWSSRVAFYAGTLQGSATHAATAAQVSGLRDTLLMVAVLVFIAFLFSLWALYQVLSQKNTARRQSNPAVDKGLQAD